MHRRGFLSRLVGAAGLALGIKALSRWPPPDPAPSVYGPWTWDRDLQDWTTPIRAPQPQNIISIAEFDRLGAKALTPRQPTIRHLTMREFKELVAEPWRCYQEYGIRDASEVLRRFGGDRWS